MKVKTAINVLLLLLAIKYALLIAWTLRAAQWYVEDIYTGWTFEYDASYDATCNAGEFVDHVAAELGFTFAESKALQQDFYRAHECGAYFQG